MIQIFYFIFNFFRYVDWRSSTRGLMDKYNFLEPPLCTATCKNLQSKYGDSNLLCPGNMANLGCFFPKNSFVEVILAPFLFLSPSGEISQEGKTMLGSGDPRLRESRPCGLWIHESTMWVLDPRVDDMGFRSTSP